MQAGAAPLLNKRLLSLGLPRVGLLSMGLLSTGLSLSACTTPPSIPNPPPSAVVSEIDELQGREAVGGGLLAPAAQMFNPNTEQVVENAVRVSVQTSDDGYITRVELRRRSVTPGGADEWRGELTLDANEEAFSNPFVFTVPFVGSESGLTENELEVIATDDLGQVNKPYSLTVKVDGSLPRLAATLPRGEVSGEVTLFGDADDPESGVTSFDVFVDDKAIGESVISGVTSRSYEAMLDTTTLENGRHRVDIIVTNGVGESVTESFFFEVFNE